MADRKKKPYTEFEIELGLRALAEFNGSPTQAERALKARGHVIKKDSIRLWAEKWPDRYAQVREEELPKVRARAADEHMEIARKAVILANATLDKLADELPNLKGKEVADVLRNVSTVAGIHTDKSQSLSGMPTAIVEHRTLKQLLRGLASKGVITLPESAVVEERGELESGAETDSGAGAVGDEADPRGVSSATANATSEGRDAGTRTSKTEASS